MARLSDTERLKLQAQKVAQEQARLADLQKRINARERKQDTQRKIIIGGMVLALMEKDAALAEQITGLARRKLTRAQDRAAFPEWFPEQAAKAAPDVADTTPASTEAAKG